MIMNKGVSGSFYCFLLFWLILLDLFLIHHLLFFNRGLKLNWMWWDSWINGNVKFKYLKEKLKEKAFSHSSQLSLFFWS